MNVYERRLQTLTLGAALCSAAWLPTGCDLNLSGSADSAALPTQESMDAEDKAAAAARAKDPAWKPSHEQVAVIRVGEAGKGGSLRNFCVHPDGTVLACWGTASENAIRRYSPEGKLLGSWKLEAQPQAICVHRDGSVYVGGDGRILRLGRDGQVLAAVDTPVKGAKVKLSQTTLDALKQEGRAADEEIARYQKNLESRRNTVTGIAVTDQDLFVVCPSTSDFSYQVYRFDRELKAAKLVVEGLRGCCGQMDLQAADGRLWIPHNARHRVECRDREGKEVRAFGKYSRKDADAFGGCCEPKNLRIGPKGDVFAAESGPPVAIKHFSAEGKFLGVVGLPNYKSDCVRVSVDASPDGDRFYILNTGDDAIHVLAPIAQAAATH